MSILELRVQNGAYFLWRGEKVDDSPEPIVREAGESDVSYFAGVLRRILEDSGPSHSRHSQANVYVEIKPGDKSEGASSIPSTRSRLEMTSLAKLETAQNGWMLRVGEQTYVYEFSDEEEAAEREAFARLLRQLAESVGPSTSRYSAERIYVEVRPGDKFGQAVADGASHFRGDEEEEEESEC